MFSFRQFINESETFYPFTKKQADALAQEQRIAPEDAMLRVQTIMGGGVINPAVEHIGDLIHRMCERVTWDSAGYEFVKNKVKKTLNWLTDEYGFEREFEENIKNTAEYRKIDEKAFRQKIYTALDIYAKEHSKLKPLNKAQQLANDAAILLGMRQFDSVVRTLQSLQKHLGTKSEWISFAHDGVEEIIKEAWLTTISSNIGTGSVEVFKNPSTIEIKTLLLTRDVSRHTGFKGLVLDDKTVVCFGYELYHYKVKMELGVDGVEIYVTPKHGRDVIIDIVPETYPDDVRFKMVSKNKYLNQQFKIQEVGYFDDEFNGDRVRWTPSANI